MEGGTLILIAETYAGQEGHKPNTSNVRALEVSIATGDSRISVVGVHISTGSRPAEEVEVFLFLSVIAEFAEELILREFNAPKICWVCETFKKIHLSINSRSSCIKMRWSNTIPEQIDEDPSKYLQPLVLTRTPNDIGRL